jgi:multisubunit Na+/H+ antiporter MnhB subunit
MDSRLETWLVVAVVMLNAYCAGANCVERFVNYGSWQHLTDSDFAAYHRAQQPSILTFVVAPLAISFLLQMLLLWHRPPEVGRALVWLMLAASLVGFLSTAFIQIPIHRKLDHGFSAELIARLLNTDWIRKVADMVRIVASIAILRNCLK